MVEPEKKVGLVDKMSSNTMEMEEKRDKPDAEVTIETESRMLFPVQSVPSPLLFPVFSLQYLLLTIPGVLTTAVLVSEVVAGEEADNVRSEMFSIGLITGGISTLLQILFGSRLPIMEGSNAVTIVAIVTILRSAKIDEGHLGGTLDSVNNSSSTEPWHDKMALLQGNLLLASLTHFLLGATGLAGFLLRFIGPVTLGPTVALVGLSIAEQMIPLCEQQWGMAALSVILVVLFSLVMSRVTVPFPTFNSDNSTFPFPIFQINAVVLAVGLSWLMCHVLTVTDVFPSNSTMPGHLARTDIRLHVIDETPWLYVPQPFKFGMPIVTGSGYTGMLIVTIVTIMEVISGYYAFARVTDTVAPPVHAVNRGIAVNGLGCMVCAVFGNVAGNVSYLSNLGCMAVTRVASRSVFLVTGVVMIVFGVVGKLGAVFTLMPDPVIGGVTVLVFAMLATVGISMLKAVNLNSTRNLVIVGLCIFLGLKLPKWTEDNLHQIKTGSSEADQILTVLLTTPMFITVFIGCLLDNLLPGTAEDRGMLPLGDDSDSDSSSYSTGIDVYEFPWITPLLHKLTCCVYCPMSPTFQADCSCRGSKSADFEVEEQSENKSQIPMDGIVNHGVTPLDEDAQRIAYI